MLAHQKRSKTFQQFIEFWSIFYPNTNLPWEGPSWKLLGASSFYKLALLSYGWHCVEIKTQLPLLYLISRPPSCQLTWYAFMSDIWVCSCECLHKNTQRLYRKPSLFFSSCYCACRKTLMCTRVWIVHKEVRLYKERQTRNREEHMGWDCLRLMRLGRTLVRFS